MKPIDPQIKSTKSAPKFFSSDVSAARRFYLDLKPRKGRPLVVVCGGLEHSTPNYAIQRDTFPFYCIEYVARGSGNLALNDRTYSLQPGRLFSYGPGISQHITRETGEPLVKYFVDFVGSDAATLLRSCGLTPGSVSQVFPANALEPIFDELIRVGLHVRHSTEKLCVKLLECLALRIAGAVAPVSGAESIAFTTYQQCRNYIEEQCLKLRTLAEIASDCHVNDAYLCRLFRRFDNQTPYQYLLRLKMNHAAERLQQPGVLIKQVATESGFADPFHFSRVFTSVFGLSPSHFRGLRSAAST